MANKSAKRQALNNAAILSKLRLGFLISNSLFLGIRGFWFYATMTWTLWTIYIITSLIAVGLYVQLIKMAQPRIDSSGGLVDGGDNLSQEGLTSYMFDVIYVTWFIHASVSLISDSFWWLYSVIPCFALYKLISLCLGLRNNPMLQGVAQEQEITDKESKKPKIKYVRG